MVTTPDVEATVADSDMPGSARSWLRGLLEPKVFIGLVMIFKNDLPQAHTEEV